MGLERHLRVSIIGICSSALSGLGYTHGNGLSRMEHQSGDVALSAKVGKTRALIDARSFNAGMTILSAWDGRLVSAQKPWFLPASGAGSNLKLKRITYWTPDNQCYKVAWGSGTGLLPS